MLHQNRLIMHFDMMCKCCHHFVCPSALCYVVIVFSMFFFFPSIHESGRIFGICKSCSLVKHFRIQSFFPFRFIVCLCILVWIWIKFVLFLFIVRFFRQFAFAICTHSHIHIWKKIIRFRMTSNQVGFYYVKYCGVLIYMRMNEHTQIKNYRSTKCAHVKLVFNIFGYCFVWTKTCLPFTQKWYLRSFHAMWTQVYKCVLCKIYIFKNQNL